MTGDSSNWSELYTRLYASMGNSNPSLESDIERDIGHLLTSYYAPMPPLVPSTPVGFPYTSPYGDTPYPQNHSPANSSTGQRQQATNQLRINTQLIRSQTNGPESSTTSSTSWGTLRTPYSQSYPGFQPAICNSPLQSASTESGRLMRDFGKLSLFPTSPLSPYAPGLESDTHNPPPPLPEETDIVTQKQMPHILEWTMEIERCGTVDFVPQKVYKPNTETDQKRYIQEVKLEETILFGTDSSEFGISLDDALKQRFRQLKDKDDRMFTNCGPSVSIRIHWPGYAPWSRQIPTMDFKTPRGRITRVKLAKNIANCVRRFAKDMEVKPMEAESDKRWKVGKQHIKAEDLILVSLHHVSKGSWQPQLRLRGQNITFSRHWDHSSVSAPAF